ncbi:hypothetical protein F5Y14DRAFT_110610 [Nemania sp. NC0429]|nr:hypothetical protein F5Y14DRAFT_110610 [Nemania sp. NC0429]
MGPPSSSPSPSPVTSDQAGIRNTTTDPSGIDRQTKKRMQNRVAQRTYRTRIKQRLRDLQQQVNTLQKKEEGQQYSVHQLEFGADNSGNERISPYGPHSGDLTLTPALDHNRERSNMEVPYQEIPELKTTELGPWPSHSSIWNPPLRPASFVYNNSVNIPTRSLPGLPSGATMQASPPRHLPMSVPGTIDGLQAFYREPQRDPQDFGRGVEDNPPQHIPTQTSNPLDERLQASHFRGFNPPRSSAWEPKLELRAIADDSISATADRHQTAMSQPMCYEDEIMTAPMTTEPIQWPGHNLPSTQTTVEEQFEYVLSCAQRVGFDSFDTMALHYYTRNFNPTSALALEQRLSRNRRLPELLAELRRQSMAWNTWQRRGYEDETLKAAEEICTMEYNAFRKSEVNNSEGETMNEAILGDVLPSLWALLTGLVSSNSQLSQRQTSERVIMAMRLLCGLEGSQNQSVTSSSRQSPR